MRLAPEKSWCNRVLLSGGRLAPAANVQDAFERNVDPVGPGVQFVTQLVQRLLPQVCGQQCFESSSVGRPKITRLSRREITSQESGRHPLRPEFGPLFNGRCAVLND